MILANDTIAAIATPPGKGGVGIVRISGPKALEMANCLTGQSPDTKPRPRYAHYRRFVDENQQLIDEGICLYFPAPHSFTGEDVVELQGHGGPVVMDLLLNRILQLGARLARPGEFSERAFLNDKLDLAQAEAIADLIDAQSASAARSAMRSLQGVFSEKIHDLVEGLTQLRMYVEAAIDFPEEEIDFITDGRIASELEAILQNLESVLQQAQQGALLKEGMTIVIAGRPNAGKSSLLNALCGEETAIVTDIAGTTRDVIREHIQLDGMPVHVIDTAGLREATDKVEQIGIERTWQEIRKADRILVVIDSTEPAVPPEITEVQKLWPEFSEQLHQHQVTDEKILLIRNKADLSGETPGISERNGQKVVTLSARNREGLDALIEALKQAMGYHTETESQFIARRRHLEALQKAREYLQQGQQQLNNRQAGELLAEDLRYAQNALGEITGEVSADDLLGRIFSSFCIGK